MVVAAQSPWFESLLYGHGREAGESSDLIDVGGGVVDADAFRDVLHFIYNDEIPATVTGAKKSAKRRSQAMLRLFEAADYYLMDRLRTMCAVRLCDFITASTVDTIAEYAEAYSCKELQQACKNFAERNRMILMPNLEFIQGLMSAQATRRIMGVDEAPSTSQQAAH
jgi:speckle-type POZ protein